MVDIQTLTIFFVWCTIINGGLLILWTLFLMLAPDLVYRTQSKFFPIQRDTFNAVIYAFLGLFKVFFIVFNITPLVALSIVG